MPLCRVLLSRVWKPGESPVDRTRKELVVPVYLSLSLACMLGFMLSVCSKQYVSLANTFTRAAMMSLVLVCGPAGLYILHTKSISTALCEFPALVIASCVVLFDVGRMLAGGVSVIELNVMVLDSLLLCGCSDRTSRAVIVLSTVWTVMRSVMVVEGAGGDACHTATNWLSTEYAGKMAALILPSTLVITVDFVITRGFARSMHAQKALVDASIRVCEVAAVRLSRYEADETRTLLEGSDGERLPEGLRAALLQLVSNLAQYRPYLPQSCLPCEVPEESQQDDQQSRFFRDRSSWSDGANDSTCSDRTDTIRAGHSPTLRRRVSLVAVNSRGFLGTACDISAVRAFICTEVEAFLGAVAAERGVVELVGGDHMYADFNATRLCTTHRASAARVAWSMVETSGTLQRSGCACSGVALGGDFGTSEMRRFMVLGPVFNTSRCLERVSAQLGMALVDDVVAADADVEALFFQALLERVWFPKRDDGPFLVWCLSGQRQRHVSVDEWMYELERRVRNPHESWNSRLREWLAFGKPLTEGEAAAAPFAASVYSLTRRRQQSVLSEATIFGATVAFAAPEVDGALPVQKREEI